MSVETDSQEAEYKVFPINSLHSSEDPNMVVIYMADLGYSKSGKRILINRCFLNSTSIPLSAAVNIIEFLPKNTTPILKIDKCIKSVFRDNFMEEFGHLLYLKRRP